MDSGIEGSLLISLEWRRQQVESVEITSSRPLSLPRIFLGKEPSEVCSTLPLLYSVCGLAQGSAAAEAFEQALPIDSSMQITRLRRLLVAFETVKEHLWRIEIDWVRFLGLGVDREPLATVMTLLRRFQAALFAARKPFEPGMAPVPVDRQEALVVVSELESVLASTIFSCAPAEWLLQMEAGGFQRWLSSGHRPVQLLLKRLLSRGEADIGGVDLPVLGSLDMGELNRRLTASDAEAFVSMPEWKGEVLESTPYSRQREHPLLRALIASYGSSLLPRLTARLVEVATLVGEMAAALRNPGFACSDSARTNMDNLTDGVGISQVEAARGKLIHRVELKDGRVGRYQIVAPTEWNFHPRGVLAQALSELKTSSDAELRSRAELLINAIDPCVGYRLAINGVGE